MLQVTERQTTEQWNELSGSVEASEMFPSLLAGSKKKYSVKEHPDSNGRVIATEKEQVEGHYNGYLQELDDMRDEVEAVNEAARERFWPAAVEAASKLIQAGQPILRDPLEDVEIEALEEAAKILRATIPWDAQEAVMLAQRAAERAAQEAKWKAEREAEEAKIEAFKRSEPEMERLFRAGATQAEVVAAFDVTTPHLRGRLSQLVGRLRGMGVTIPRWSADGSPGRR